MKFIVSAGDDDQPIVLYENGYEMLGRRSVVAAAMSIEDIRRAYYAQRSGATRYTWVREVRVDPLELIVDDDEGTLLSVPVSINGDNITFGDAKEVKVEYVNASRRLVVAHWDREPDRVHDDASMSDPDDKPTIHQEATQMLSEEALTALGLPADADEDAINAAILQASEQIKVAASAGLQVPEGMALVDAATLNELREGTVLARSLRQEQLDRERDAAIDAAITEGKIPPARRDHYVAMFAADREGAISVLASLAPGLVPVKETGTGNDQTTTPDTDDAYPEDWGRNVAAANRRTGSVRITGGND